MCLPIGKNSTCELHQFLDSNVNLSNLTIQLSFLSYNLQSIGWRSPNFWIFHRKGKLRNMAPILLYSINTIYETNIRCGYACECVYSNHT
jgi:hypothetical protein